MQMADGMAEMASGKAGHTNNTTKNQTKTQV
jgi:hypothetical protein